MSGVDGSEIVLLLIIGLIVLGPRRLPEIASKLGSWVGQARRMTRVMKRQLEEELNLDENPSIKNPKASRPSVANDAPDPADPAYDIDEPVADHIPNDDDSYSALHDESDSDDADPGQPADKTERGQEA